MKETIWYKHKLTKFVATKWKGQPVTIVIYYLLARTMLYACCLNKTQTDYSCRERWITSYIIYTSMLQVVHHLVCSGQVGLKVCLSHPPVNVVQCWLARGWRGGGDCRQPHCPELTSLWTIYSPTPFQWYSYSDGERTSCYFHLTFGDRASST
jgi:hypothetical protein